MPECTSTGCRRERLSRFFAIGAVRRLRGVAVDCLTHLGTRCATRAEISYAAAEINLEITGNQVEIS